MATIVGYRDLANWNQIIPEIPFVYDSQLLFRAYPSEVAFTIKTDQGVYPVGNYFLIRLAFAKDGVRTKSTPQVGTT